MNRLRKIASWFWLSKERMVLAVMVIFLSLRVYQIVKPGSVDPGGERPAVFRPPGSQLSDDVETPGTPPRVPPPPPPQNWTNIWRRNPWIYVSPGDSIRSDNDSGNKIDLVLLNLQERADGTYKVQLRSPNGRRRWYSEGDSFEAYQVLTIDPEGPCVEIYSEELSDRQEICKDQ